MSFADQARIAAVPMALMVGAGALLFAFQQTAPPAAADPWAHVPRPLPHTPHETFFRDAALTDGPSVTRRCVDCHEDAAEEVMHTSHFRWEGDPVVVPGHEDQAPMPLGKKHVINNYCIGIQGGNWPSCTRCHAGYGWEDDGYDFSQPDHVDCLVCHDQSGGYVKGLAGQPEDDVDLLAAAKSVGRPTRWNCGACHFSGGGGDAVKHGDLDGTMLNPNERIDVHMGRHDFQCVDCHGGQDHQIRGRSISVSIDDTRRVRCTDCHADAPHADARLDAHTATLACQTCHIPQMGGDAGTKLAWDWSTAGDQEREAAVADPHAYQAIKGSFDWGHGAEPSYAWYNGRADRYLLGERIDPDQTTVIAGPLGDVHDPTARIWPFKVHRGKQIYDTESRQFIVPKTWGEGGYWTTLDWSRAAELGARASGMAYSGSYGFAPTAMYWPLSHMVQTRERSLQCVDCHGPEGRMDWEALGFVGDPLHHGGRAKQGLLK